VRAAVVGGQVGLGELRRRIPGAPRRAQDRGQDRIALRIGRRRAVKRRRRDADGDPANQAGPVSQGAGQDAGGRWSPGDTADGDGAVARVGQDDPPLGAMGDGGL
jgi:hypothetical protein